MKIRYLLVAMTLLSSCIKLPVPESVSHWEKAVAIPITLHAQALEESKSSMNALSLLQINNVNYYLFQNGQLMDQRYFDDASETHVTLPEPDGSYNLYLLANCGEIGIPLSTREDNLGTAVHVDFGSKANYLSVMESGVPMYGGANGFSAASSTSFTLTRLVHRIEVEMDTSMLLKTHIQFTSLKIRQAARDIYPFASQSRATAVVDGDEASYDDLQRLNSGEKVSLYVLENMRGNLLSASSWGDKVPSRISSASERGLATFLELTARVETPTATYSETTYRTFLGLSPSNFDLKRNHCFTLRSTFTSEMVLDEDWRIDSGDAEITGDLRFVGTQSASDDVEEFFLMKGFSAVYYVYRSNPDIDFTLSADTSPTISPYVSFLTAPVDDNYTAVLFRTDKALDRSVHYENDDTSLDDTDDVVLTLTSTDGLLSDSIRCKVLKKAFGIRFYYTTSGDLRMKLAHPQGLAFYVYFSGTMKGSVTFKPNGTWGRSQTRTSSVAIANAQSSTSALTKVSSEGIGVRIDNYRYISGIERNSQGFIEYLNDVWGTIGWDSYTALNGSNGYNKHAHPTELTMDMSISFTSLDPLHWHPDSDATFPVYSAHETPRIVYAGTSDEYVVGAGTDWYFYWDQCDREGDSPMRMIFTTSTYKVSGGSIVPGNSYQDGSDKVPIHININGVDNQHNYSFPLAGQFQSIDYYADASNWK